MFSPQDLKNKNFSRTVRGYNPLEVDEYIQFLLQKFEKLHAENAELEKRLHIVSGKYEELANDEEAIRNAVAQAQKLSEKMIAAAEKSADEILERVNLRCEEMIEDAQIKVEAEEQRLAELRISAAAFKELLIREYTNHLKLTREAEIPSAEEVEREFPTHKMIRQNAMDDLIPNEIIERAVLNTASDPSLEEFKRFVRPQKTMRTPEESDALAQAYAEGKLFPGHLADRILESNVDSEELENDAEALLAEAPQMSVEEALLSSVDEDLLHPEEDNDSSDRDESLTE